MRLDPLGTQIVVLQTNVFVYIKATIRWLNSPIEAAYSSGIPLRKCVGIKFIEYLQGVGCVASHHDLISLHSLIYTIVCVCYMNYMGFHAQEQF